MIMHYNVNTYRTNYNHAKMNRRKIGIETVSDAVLEYKRQIIYIMFHFFLIGMSLFTSCNKIHAWER